MSVLFNSYVRKAPMIALEPKDESSWEQKSLQFVI